MYPLVNLNKPKISPLPLLILFFMIVSGPANAQRSMKVKILADMELSSAGSDSHFFFNEIDKDFTNWRFGLSQLNLITQININKQVRINSRVLAERDHGREFGRLVLPQFNLQYLSKDRKYGLTLGAFTNPFGSFNKHQLSTDRNLIGLPLAYSFYNNISEKLGYVDGLGDIVKIPLKGEVQWGRTNLYYGGYTLGAMFSWAIKPSKLGLKVALVNGASNIQFPFTSPMHLGVISRLKIQPTYFWEQGISFSHGTFMQESPISDILENLRQYSQTLIGTDYKLGMGHLEFSGEIIFAAYKVPVVDFSVAAVKSVENLNNLAVYLDAKYELLFLQGSYIACRIDHLRFSKISDGLYENWDNNILRNSLGIGYNVTRNILVRAFVSTQNVQNKDWGKTQRTFRLVLTAHY